MNSTKRIYSYSILVLGMLVSLYSVLLRHRPMGPPATNCFWYTTTQLACPACGGSHAIHDMVHGHIVSAFSYNALISILYLISVLCIIWISVDLLNKTYSFEKTTRHFISILKNKKYSYLLAFVILSLWVLNILRYWK